MSLHSLIHVGLLLALAAVAACATGPETPEPTSLEREGARLLRAGNHRAALELFREASRQQGATYNASVGMALCHAEVGSQALFEQYALEASGRAPATPSAFSALGRMYVRGAERLRRGAGSERYAAIGVEYLRRVAAADADAPHIYGNLGVGYHLMGDHRAAVTMLEEAHRRVPERVEVLHMLLVSLRRLGQAERVLDLLARNPAPEPLVEAWRGHATWARERLESAEQTKPE